MCGGSVWQNKDESKYCFRCGQALDWGDVLKTVGNRLASMGVDTRVDKEKTFVDQFDKNLQSFGVQIKNSSSEYKDLYSVFLELSRRWNG